MCTGLAIYRRDCDCDCVRAGQLVSQWKWAAGRALPQVRLERAGGWEARRIPFTRSLRQLRSGIADAFGLNDRFTLHAGDQAPEASTLHHLPRGGARRSGAAAHARARGRHAHWECFVV